MTCCKNPAASYAALWAFGLAFGWIEATTVLYLFAVNAPNGPYVGGLDYPLAALPIRLSVAEVVREACTIVLLASTSWLASARWAGRIGAFFLLFGLWDLVYYVGLAVLAQWPTSLTTWDVLFLIPLPWVGPVWAPALVAVVFAAGGSHLFLTADRPRAYRWLDVAVLLAAATTIVLTFLVDWQLVMDRSLPHRFPRWLFLLALGVGAGWFVRTERKFDPAGFGALATRGRQG